MKISLNETDEVVNDVVSKVGVGKGGIKEAFSNVVIVVRVSTDVDSLFNKSFQTDSLLDGSDKVSQNFAKSKY